ncbi:hypothetical protein [Acinetobacter sp. YH12021]|uniref:hypothetical protein n=1 Tax=Acinetobacter sp. YH12021 TaxID=2601040 RepID=UPI0015D30D16|nr:hypothetical protein [Acinetobacter sp. YH12021]
MKNNSDDIGPLLFMPFVFGIIFFMVDIFYPIIMHLIVGGGGVGRISSDDIMSSSGFMLALHPIIRALFLILIGYMTVDFYYSSIFSKRKKIIDFMWMLIILIPFALCFFILHYISSLFSFTARFDYVKIDYKEDKIFILTALTIIYYIFLVLGLVIRLIKDYFKK